MKLTTRMKRAMSTAFRQYRHIIFYPSGFYVHGTHDQVFAAFKELAAEGFLVIKTNYRCEAGHVVWGGEEPIPGYLKHCDECASDDGYNDEDDEAEFTPEVFVELREKAKGTTEKQVPVGHVFGKPNGKFYFVLPPGVQGVAKKGLCRGMPCEDHGPISEWAVTQRKRK